MHPSNAKAVTSRFRIYTCITCTPRIKVWMSLYPLVSAKQRSTMPYQRVHVLKNALFGWEYSMEETICALQCIVCADECVHRTLWVPADCLCHKSSETFWFTIWLGTLLNIYLWQRATEEKRTSPCSLSMNPRHTLAASWKMGHDLFTTEERLS